MAFKKILGVCVTLLLCFQSMRADKTLGNLNLFANNGLKARISGDNNSFLNLELGLLNGLPTQLQESSGSPMTAQYTIFHSNTLMKVHQHEPEEGVHCYTISWPNPPSHLEDCIELGDALWYGGGELFEQHWPISNLDKVRIPYVTGDFYHHPYGGLIARIWFNSEGHSVTVDPKTPLFLRFNQSGDGKMCFSASTEEYPYENSGIGTTKELKYTMCSAPNVRKIFEYSIGRTTRKPRSSIDEEVLMKPIWSTWAKYKADINHSIVLDFTKSIADHGFPVSHLEIDDKWETCYGNLEFDTDKFPDPADTIRQIKAMGFRVSFWVHPFTNVDCSTYEDKANKGYFVKEFGSTNNTPHVTTWWNGNGGYLDVTNPEAVDDMASKLSGLQTRYGIDTYKFDAGELHWMTPGFMFTNPEIMKTPVDFTKLYAELASRFGQGVEVRVAYDSQELPIFVRMLDKDSVWGYGNGLKSLIPVSLLFSVTGYPYILPDMIGGNNYNSASPLPDRELFVRWLELNAFLPALQFSLLPWDYDEATSQLTKKYIELHQQYVPLMKRLGDEAVLTGAPIIRPLWWTDPTDEVALSIDSEFLVGEDLLVAPVVERGAVKRDVYLPSGTWKGLMDGRNNVHNGPGWLRDYPAPLEQIPYFSRLK